MNIIICNKDSFRYFEDYIHSIKKIINAQLLLFEHDINITFESKNNYIFMQTIHGKFLKYIEDTTNHNIFVINTEQLSDENRKNNINKYPKQLQIIDYINSNIKYYDSRFKTYVLPYHINKFEILDTCKEKSVCLIGSIDNIPVNRQTIINQLHKQHIHVDIVTGFGKKRDAELFKYKIILNIGYTSNNCKIMETFRCDRCVYNKMIVISDLKEDMDDYHLKDHVVFTDYIDIPDTVIKILDNYDEYYNKLFSNLDLDEINRKLVNSSKNLIDRIC